MKADPWREPQFAYRFLMNQQSLRIECQLLPLLEAHGSIFGCQHEAGAAAGTEGAGITGQSPSLKNLFTYNNNLVTSTSMVRLRPNHVRSLGFS